MSEITSNFSWVITETQDGIEVEVSELFSLEEAYSQFLDYTSEELERLIPCIYKKLPNGDLTTEY